MILKLLFVFLVIGLLPIFFHESFAASQDMGNSPFDHPFGDVKFLDAYFGTLDNKIEVEAGDSNVPFTVVLANVGTQDITGIRVLEVVNQKFVMIAVSNPEHYIRLKKKRNRKNGNESEL